MVRYAFTLIELIFAIVIIGIAVITLPTMNQATTKGIEGNLVQEAIFAASTELNQAVTANWDDNSLEPGFPNSQARVIQINTGIGDCDNNTSSPTYRRMAGHINQPLHRRCLDSNTTTLSLVNIDTVNSLNDMKTSNTKLENATTNATGYKLDFTTTVSITNINVFFGMNKLNANPNMKQVTVEVSDTSTPPKLITKLFTYSANIGEVDYYKRNF